MENFREKWARFMKGRYGIDELYYALIALAFILLLTNLLVRSPFLEIILWTVIIGTVCRSFSRNIYRRQAENQRFLKILNPLKKKGFLTLRRIKEINTHRYRRCPHCQKILRLPRKKGTHSVTCPVCRQEFKIRLPW